MKVCLLNDSFPPVIDGVVNVMMNYADYMMRDYGAEIMVGTPRYPDTDYSVYPYRVVAYPSLDTASVTNGYRAGNPLSGREISEMVDFMPDIIHTHCPASATVVARLLREATGAPVIFTYHTKYDIDIRRAVKIEPVAREGIHAMVKNIEACDDIWVVSRGAGESLRALGFQGDYRVMNNGVDFARGRVDARKVAEATAGYDLPEGVPVFLFVGRMMTYKGLPLILDALRILDEKGLDFRMVFVGKGPDRELLEAKARDLGLLGDGGGAGENGQAGGSSPADGGESGESSHEKTTGGKCIFTGPIYDRDVLRAWNTRADLFLFPSTFDTNGLVVREAAACGLASVLIRDSCAAEGITDGRNGFIIDESAEAMAALLARVSADLDHLRDVGQHAMDEIYLSWEECVAKAYDRYQVVLAEKKIGMLPRRKKQVTDTLVRMAARNMEGQDRIRKFGRDLMGDFRETAVGMMENFQEAADSSEHFWNNVAQEMREEMKSRSVRVRSGMESGTQKIREGMESGAQKVRSGLQELREEAKNTAEEMRWEMRSDVNELRRDMKSAAREWKDRKASLGSDGNE